MAFKPPAKFKTRSGGQVIKNCTRGRECGSKEELGEKDEWMVRMGSERNDMDISSERNDAVHTGSDDTELVFLSTYHVTNLESRSPERMEMLYTYT